MKLKTIFGIVGGITNGALWVTKNLPNMGAAAVTFMAVGSGADEARASETPDIFDSSGYSDIVHDEITDPIADLIYMDEEPAAKQSAFIQTSSKYSEDGFVDVKSQNYQHIQQFDLSSMYELCQNNPEDCPPPASGFTVFLGNSSDLLKIVNGVNLNVNHGYEQKSDWDVHGVSDFAQRVSIAGAGDCEDFVLEKRAQLIEAGISDGALRNISVLTEKGEAHEVLGVSTINGVILLDNRSDDLVMLQNSDYEVVAASSPKEPWKKFGLTNTYDDSFERGLAAQEEARNAPLDDSQPDITLPLPRPRPKGFDPV